MFGECFEQERAALLIKNSATAVRNRDGNSAERNSSQDAGGDEDDIAAN